VKIREFKGYEGFRAMQTFCKLVLGLKMIPQYSSFEYLDFLSVIHEMTENDTRLVLREAILLVDLTEDECLSLCVFGSDINGVPYGKVNIKNLTIADSVNVMIEVCLKLSEIKIDALTDDQKKN